MKVSGAICSDWSGPCNVSIVRLHAGMKNILGVGSYGPDPEEIQVSIRV